jgi:holo-[acyl-carrier protein] synthase
VDAPGVVGVGTDLVDVEELRLALDRTPGLAERLFTGDELAYAHRHRDPVIHLAARAAAKEAVMKALGKGISHIGFTEIEVDHDADGRPVAVLHGRALAEADRQQVGTLHLSLTHTRTLAQAFVVAAR